MKRFAFLILALFSLNLAGANTPDLDLSRHRLGMGGGISLMNDRNSGMGYGAAAEYQFRPFSQLPLSVGLEASAVRFDTAETNVAAVDLFQGTLHGDIPMSLSLISVLVKVNYVAWENSVVFVAPTVGYGQSITAETRRQSVSTGALSPITTDTQNRDLVSLGLDVGFKLNAQNSIVVRPQYQIMKHRNFFTPLVLLTTTL